MAHVTIEIRYADRPAETRKIGNGTLLIGREAGDIILNDPQVSARHAELRVEGTRITFTDLGSSNGSFTADGSRITTPQLLHIGSAVRISGCSLIVQSVEAPTQSVAPQRKFAGTMVMGPGVPLRAPSATNLQGSTDVSHAPAPPAAGSVGAPPPPAASGAPPPPLAGPASAPPPPAVAAGAPPTADPAATAADPAATATAVASPATPDAAGPTTDAPPGFGATDSSVWGDGESDAATDAVSEDAVPMFATTNPEPVGTAGEGMKGFGGQIKKRLVDTWQIYEPHMKPLGKLLGMIVLPFALIIAVAGFVPVLGALVSIPVGILLNLVVWLLVMGISAEYTLRIHLGEATTPAAAMKVQTGRLASWAISTFVAFLIAGFGLLAFLIGAAALGWAIIPAYTVEGKRNVALNGRSFELFKKDWLFILQGLGIPFIGVMLPYYFLMMFVAFIPGIRGLSPLFDAAYAAVAMPFVQLYLYRLYFEVRRRIEAGDPESEARAVG